MNRIEKRLEELKQENKKAFITYTTAGLPDLQTTAKLIFAQEEAGADILEIGVPFSDPVADGPVIQNASYQAIQKGATLTKIFDMIEGVRKEKCEVPIVFMMYYNTVYHYGLEAFVTRCIECGVDGLIIPDLPFEEQGELKAVLAKNEASPILIQLVSPVSKQRVPMLLENARGFVYCVSSLGVTGVRKEFDTRIDSFVAKVKEATDTPACIGFGISTKADVERFDKIADGCIVGSAIVKLCESYGADCVPYIKEYVKSMKDAIK